MATHPGKSSPARPGRGPPRPPPASPPPGGAAGARRCAAVGAASGGGRHTGAVAGRGCRRAPTQGVSPMDQAEYERGVRTYEAELAELRDQAATLEDEV